MISILFASTTAGGCVVKTCRINLRAPLICPPLEASRSARGGQIKGALKLIRHVFTTHPPAVVDANKIEIIQQVLSRISSGESCASIYPSYWTISKPRRLFNLRIYYHYLSPTRKCYVMMMLMVWLWEEILRLSIQQHKFKFNVFIIIWDIFTHNLTKQPRERVEKVRGKFVTNIINISWELVSSCY